MYHSTLYIAPTRESWSKLKQPFDEEFTKLLESAAVLVLKKWFRGNGELFIHQYGLIISIPEDVDFNFYLETTIISFITAYVNKNYSKFILFEVRDMEWHELEDEKLWEGYMLNIRQTVIGLAESAYEMFVENAKLSSNDDFFPGVGYTTFDKTPDSYKVGITRIL